MFSFPFLAGCLLSAPPPVGSVLSPPFPLKGLLCWRRAGFRAVFVASLGRDEVRRRTVGVCAMLRSRRVPLEVHHCLFEGRERWRLRLLSRVGLQMEVMPEFEDVPLFQ